MTTAESQHDEHAGTQELVQILGMIVRAKMAYPRNPRIASLDAAAKKVIDPELFQAVLLQLAAQGEELARTRKSPLAQMMGQR